LPADDNRHVSMSSNKGRPRVWSGSLMIGQIGRVGCFWTFLGTRQTEKPIGDPV
jgi:hypothetical protein